MAIDATDLTDISKIRELLELPWWHKADFWLNLALGTIGVIVGGFGLYYSIQAFSEAKKAAKAATAAGDAVKIYTVGVELSEARHSLGKLHKKIQYEDARGLLQEINARIRRAVTPLNKISDLESKVTKLTGMLDTAEQQLQSVKPANFEKESDAPYAVYTALEGNFTAINNLVAELLGAIDQRSQTLGA